MAYAMTFKPDFLERCKRMSGLKIQCGFRRRYRRQRKRAVESNAHQHRLPDDDCRIQPRIRLHAR